VVLLLVLELLAGDVIATTGTTPVTVVDVGADEPNELAQATVKVFAPATIGLELVLGVVELAPLMVQVVPAGIVEEPSTVYATLIGVVVLVEPLAGAVIATEGTLPLITLIAAEPLPIALAQATVTGLLPSDGSEAELLEVLDDATPFTVQVVPDGIVVEPFTV
jgi:hypothetical protein